MNLKLTSFENPTQARVTSRIRDTEASSAYIFQRHIHTSDTSVNSNNCEIM